MIWTFSIGWFIVGLLVMAAGGAVVFFYKQIADNLASGINSYNKIKLGGIIAIGVGFLLMTNLHTALLSGFIRMIMPNI